MSKFYASPTSLRTSLEERLKKIARTQNIDLQRLRRQVAFERFLCRLFQSYPHDLVLKGGYSIELRTASARATKDIDLAFRKSNLPNLQDPNQELFEMLQAAVQGDKPDCFRFFVGTPTLDLQAPPYGGSRFPIEAHLDGRLFERFPIDVVLTSLFIEPIEHLPSQNWLAFAGIDTPSFPAISCEQQFAEKLHAYTLPKGEYENSRVKDIVDMMLLIKMDKLKKQPLNRAIYQIFHYRNTHSIPTQPEHLEKPPKNWEQPFAKLAKECGLTENLDTTFHTLKEFLFPTHHFDRENH